MSSESIAEEQLPSTSRPSSAEGLSYRPSSRTENVTAYVTPNGLLDLSGMCLTTLSNKFSSLYEEAKELDISKNKFHSISMKSFALCKKVDIADNCFSSLSSFLPIAKKLEAIIADDNKIKLTNPLLEFVRLKSLHLSRNCLQSVPTLKLNHLKFLELSGNELTEFPDLSELPLLESLFLRKNSINSLEKAQYISSGSLKVLDVSDNPVSDLCEVYYLERVKSLVNFSIENLPCLTSFIPYHYRSFLLVLFPSLLFVNNTEINEIESFNAEFLTLRGNLTGFQSKFAPGRDDNENLSQFLLTNSVTTDKSGLVPDDPKLHKMMLARSVSRSSAFIEDKRTMSAKTTRTFQFEKDRRKSFAAPKSAMMKFTAGTESPEIITTDDDLSVHSPFGNYLAKLGKENHPVKKDKITKVISKSVKTPRMTPIRTPSLSSKSSFTSNSSQRTTISSRGSERSLSSSTIVMSGENRSSIGNNSPLLSMRIKENGTPIRKPLNSSYHNKPEKKAKALDTTITMQDENEEQLSQMQAVIDDLYHNNIGVSDIQHELSVTMMEMREKFMTIIEGLEKENEILKVKNIEMETRFSALEARCSSLEQSMKSLIPVPSSINAKRGSNGSEITLSWNVSNAKAFNLILDGDVVGTVKKTTARIIDVSENKHTVQIQAIALDGTLGQVSDIIEVGELQKDSDQY